MTDGLMTLTDSAAERVKQMIANRDKPTYGVRIGVNTSGCSGMSYTLEYADEKSDFDEIIEVKGAVLVIDSKAVMFVAGTKMDYVVEKMQSGFVFSNPNEKGRCGCGESFHV